MAAEPNVPSPGRELTASLFSRGPDSWYTVLTAAENPELRPGLTRAVYALGFNASGWSDELREASSRRSGRRLRGQAWS